MLNGKFLTGKIVGGKRALIVDSHKSVRMAVGTLLRGKAMEIHETESGMQAMVELSNSQFDIVFIDLSMPEFTGEAAVRAVHDMNPDAKLIVFTESLDDPRLVNADALGIAAMISKPATEYDIVETVKRVLSTPTLRKERE